MKQLLLSFIVVVIFNSPASHARLTALSAQNTIQIDGQSYDQVFASCGTKDNKPMLVRKKGDRQWCDSATEDVCHTNKLEVGQEVCSLSYSNRLKALNKKGNKKKHQQSNQVADLRKEAMDIEAALIEIQAKRIALLQRELGLIKQRDSEVLQASR